MKKAHVTHPELKCTFCLGILGVKKNPNGTSYTQLGVITKGTVIEVSFQLRLLGVFWLHAPQSAFLCQMRPLFGHFSAGFSVEYKMQLKRTMLSRSM